MKASIYAALSTAAAIVACAASAYAYSMIGTWDGSPDCTVRFWSDDGYSVQGNCGTSGGFDHEFRGHYTATNKIEGTTTRIAPDGCQTQVKMAITFLDPDSVVYWQEGWHGCGANTAAGTQIWHRRMP